MPTFCCANAMVSCGKTDGHLKVFGSGDRHLLSQRCKNFLDFSHGCRKAFHFQIYPGEDFWIFVNASFEFFRFHVKLQGCTPPPTWKLTCPWTGTNMNDIENWIMFHHFTSITSPTPPLHIEFVRKLFTHPPSHPSTKGGPEALPNQGRSDFFLWFFQLLNCTVANAQLKTKQLVLHDWSYWFQTVPTSHRLFCYVAKLRPSHEFLSTKNSCPTLTTGRRCVSSKNYGKIRTRPHSGPKEW